MLNELYIENVAVIEKAKVEFTDGLNVLTGETGAGKSIVIDSINAILGNRTSREIVRSGTDKAVIFASFDNISDDVRESLEESGYESDGSLLVWREITSEGKSRCRINDKPASVTKLKDICSSLINIHGQHDNQDLLNPEKHIHILDNFCGLTDLIADYKSCWSEVVRLHSELQRLEIDDSEKERKIDLLRYQIEEINSANLKPGEEERLIEQRNLIRNSEKIAEQLSDVLSVLDGDDAQSTGACSLLSSASGSLSALASLSDKFSELSSRLDDVYYTLTDISTEASSMMSELDFDADALSEIEDRLDLIYRLKRKYGNSVDEINEFGVKASNELDGIERSDEIREQCRSDLEKAVDNARDKAKIISQKRKNGSEIFSERIVDELAYLNMSNSVFKVLVEPIKLCSTGCDNVEFFLSTNAGEEPKPLSKIASGGELSRIMLAIKCALADKDDISTLIFDEIDTGISGSSSNKVGKKLKEVSMSKQTLCVTHSAQIAAFADSHLFISKKVIDGRTFTSIEPLDKQGRERELARIMSGDNITETAISNAKEMLSLAK